MNSSHLTSSAAERLHFSIILNGILSVIVPLCLALYNFSCRPLGELQIELWIKTEGGWDRVKF